MEMIRKYIGVSQSWNPPIKWKDFYTWSKTSHIRIKTNQSTSNRPQEMVQRYMALQRLKNEKYLLSA